MQASSKVWADNLAATDPGPTEVLKLKTKMVDYMNSKIPILFFFLYFFK